MTCSDSLLHSPSQRGAAGSPVFPSVVSCPLVTCSDGIRTARCIFLGSFARKGASQEPGKFAFYLLGLGTLKVTCVL